MNSTSFGHATSALCAPVMVAGMCVMMPTWRLPTTPGCLSKCLHAVLPTGHTKTSAAARLQAQHAASASDSSTNGSTCSSGSSQATSTTAADSSHTSSSSHLWKANGVILKQVGEPEQLEQAPTAAGLLLAQQPQQQVEQAGLPLSELVAQRLARVSTGPAAPGDRLGPRRRAAAAAGMVMSPHSGLLPAVPKLQMCQRTPGSRLIIVPRSAAAKCAPPSGGHWWLSMKVQQGSSSSSMKAARRWTRTKMCHREISSMRLLNKLAGWAGSAPAGSAGDGSRTATPDSSDLLPECADGTAAEAADGDFARD